MRRKRYGTPIVRTMLKKLSTSFPQLGTPSRTRNFILTKQLAPAREKRLQLSS